MHADPKRRKEKEVEEKGREIERERKKRVKLTSSLEMLVSFFGTITPLLAPHGTIIVTLFESEPYTLWNIRDLARHSGLEVQTSFRFQADAYPGYSHARTLGNIEGGGGWKGESRAARTYVFQSKERKEAAPEAWEKKAKEGMSVVQKRREMKVEARKAEREKRKREDEESSDEDEG